MLKARLSDVELSFSVFLISSISRMSSDIFLHFKKNRKIGLLILGSTFFSLRLKAFEMILYSPFVRLNCLQTVSLSLTTTVAFVDEVYRTLFLCRT